MSTNQVLESEAPHEEFDTIIIGGGQAGLAAGYHLSKHLKDFIILDENSRTGDSWRKRWDSLRLFTPSQFDCLPGFPYPGPKNYFPHKDEVADYLENYVRQLDLPVRYNTHVDVLSSNGKGFEIQGNGSRFKARNVIVATGPFQKPYTPDFSKELGGEILQLHSAAYRNPQQMPANSVLVVGAGNSGAEIALELAKAGKKVWLAGRDVGRVPANSPAGKILDGRVIWWIMTHLLTVDTPVGRKMQGETLHHGTPLGRATRDEIAAAGVELVPRIAGIQSGKLILENGQALPADGVLWATGFRPDYQWIHLPVFDEKGYPRHSRGVAQGISGLYFIGLVFQTGLASSLIGGVGEDAARISSRILQTH